MRIIKLGRFQKAVIRAGILLDGTGGQLQERVDILITDGIIRGIHSSLLESSPYISPAEDATTVLLQDFNTHYESLVSYSGVVHSADRVIKIDCSELTILPGLVDCHVHLALDGVNFEGALKRWGNEEELEIHLIDSLERTCHAGIMAVRDGGDRNQIGLGAARLAGEATVPPLVVATGQAFRKKGMYGSFLGKGLDVTNIKRAVRETARAGAGQLKVLVSGIVSFREDGKVGPLQFDRKELSFLVVEAHTAGLKVMAHANSNEGTALAVQCGVDSLEHGYFISRKTLAQMARKGIAWVPTIIPVAIQLKEPYRYNYSQAQLAVIKKTYHHQQLMVETARRLGVIVGVGTDAGASGVRHGESYIEELKLLIEAGFSPAEAISAATAKGAGILGLEKQVGKVLPGMPVYLIGVRGNPLINSDLLKKPDVILISS